MADRSERGHIVQLMPAPPGCKAYYAPGMARYDGGDQIPDIAEEQILAFALVEESRDQWIEALVNDDEDGALMPASSLDGFLATEAPGGTGRYAAEVLLARVEEVKKKPKLAGT